MRIEKKDWLHYGITSPIDKFLTWGFVRSNYCDPMTAQDLCPKKCWECIPRLRKNIEGMVVKDRKRVVGLLIWVLRRALAEAQEELREKEPVERDKYAKQVDPIDAFLEELSED
jgi:hypothetical protein